MSKCPADLWRGVHINEYPEGPIINGKPAEGVLYPSFERKQIGALSSGKPKFREADVEIIGGMVQPGGGTSLYNKGGFFKSRSWQYFYIPKDTDTGPDLKITGPEYNDFFKADHYQIEVIKALYLVAYKGALDNLARAAVKKAYEDARK